MHRSILLAVLVLTVGCAGTEAGGAQAELVAELGSSPAAGACDSSQFMTGLKPPHCCQDGDRVWYITYPPATPTTPTLFFRRLGTPCTLEDGGTNCGFGTGIQCLYGPCGGTTFKGVQADQLSVFVPEGRPDQCGWSAKGNVTCERGCEWEPNKEERFYPEPYDGQVAYGEVVGSCPARACKAGKPCLTANCSDQP